MEISPGPRQISANAPSQMDGHDRKFFPAGAIAFFILLVILCLVIWFGVYFLMIERA